MFPSPYGVSFILIGKSYNINKKEILFQVSVSLRSIIHSYLMLDYLYISYLVCFRLLTEYHSFLLYAVW